MSALPTLVDAAGRPLRSRAPVPGRRWPRRAVAAAALLALAGGPLGAQDVAPPTGTWRSLTTRWFDVHYPVETEVWTRDLAGRLDAIRDSVARRVGFAPAGRTTIVVSDPDNLPNGSAWPAINHPAILLYPTPPRPVDQIGNTRGWGDKLAAHEFAHVAHIARPARRTQWWWALAPDRGGPILLGTPRWAFEGYATHIEGLATGSGRPYGAWRAALLRTLAREGRLPSYAGMSATGGYKGGSYAYLVGSAFWDWLARQRGDTAMSLVFRRQTARTPRSFDESFRGVFGASPQELYGRFSAEVTARAMTAERTIEEAGAPVGRRLARRRYDPGALAASPDGRMLAHVAPGTGGAPPRIVVVTSDTARRGDDPRLARRERADDGAQATRDSALREALRRRDPLDVAAIRTDPPAPRVLFTLAARGARIWRRPRFVTDSLLLVEALVSRRDGTRRPELFTWSLRDGAVRQVTRDANVGDADPSPDGTRAIGVRCTGGLCDLVEVTLADGRTTTVLRGTPTTRLAQPRWHPTVDDTWVVATTLDDGTWGLVTARRFRRGTRDTVDVLPVAGVGRQGDGIDRHSPAWLPDGRSVVYVSEAGGVPDVATTPVIVPGVPIVPALVGDTRRTRVVTSAWSPLVTRDGALLYTVEHASGHDIVRADTLPVVQPLVRLGDTLWPVRPLARPRPAPTLSYFATAPVPPSRDYGAGPRRVRVLPQLVHGVDGHAAGLALAGTDPIGRLTWLLGGQASARGAWRGGNAALSWRGSRPSFRAEAAWLDLPTGAQRDAERVGATRSGWQGASAGVILPVAGDLRAHRVAATLAAGRLREGDTWGTRVALATSWNAGVLLGARTQLALALGAAGGRTADSAWARGLARVALTHRGLGVALRTQRVTRDAPTGERLVAGGQASPLVDELVLGQRVAAPFLPVGALTGRALHSLRITAPMPVLPGTLVGEALGTAFRRDGLVRTIGWETGLDTPRLDLVAIPAARLAGGVGYVVDAPLRGRVTAHVSVRLRP